MVNRPYFESLVLYTYWQLAGLDLDESMTCCLIE